MKVTINMKFAITAMLLALILIPTIQVNSVEIKDIRSSVESSKTRVVFDLDESAQYKAQYDKENNIIINIPKASISESSRSFKLKNGLVKNLSLTQTDDGTVKAKISLEEPAGYKIFTLKSPDRIVLDIASIESIIAPEVVELSPTELEGIVRPTGESKPPAISRSEKTIVETAEPEEINIENIAVEPEPLAIVTEPLDESPIESSALALDAEPQPTSRFWGIKYHLLFLYSFDMMVLVAMIFMSFRVKTAYKLAKYVKMAQTLPNENSALVVSPNSVKNDVKEEAIQNHEKIIEEKSLKNKTEDEIINDRINKSLPKNDTAKGKRKILVIDNNEVTYNLTSVISKSHGYDTIYADNEEEGLAKANDENPDLILLDLTKSAINVEEICAKLKADKNTSGISIIMLIGEGTGEAILKAREMGADDYLVRPFTRRQLLEKMSKFLEGSKVRRMFRFLDGLLYQS